MVRTYFYKIINYCLCHKKEVVEKGQMINGKNKSRENKKLDKDSTKKLQIC